MQILLLWTWNWIQYLRLPQEVLLFCYAWTVKLAEGREERKILSHGDFLSHEFTEIRATMVATSIRFHKMLTCKCSPRQVFSHWDLSMSFLAWEVQCEQISVTQGPLILNLRGRKINKRERQKQKIKNKRKQKNKKRCLLVVGCGGTHL